MMTRRERIIYLAALLEGEGCFRMSRSKGGAVGVEISLRMTDEDTVQWAAELIYGLILKPPILSIRKEERISKISKKPLYGIVLHGERAIFIMKLLLPFMGLRRSSKISEVIQAYESRVTISEAGIRRRARERRCLATQDLF